MSTVSEIQSQIIAIQQELAILNGQLISASQANDYPRITQINAEIESSRARLSALFTAQIEAQSQAALPAASSGAVISEAQQARNDGTTTSTPQAPPGQFVAGDDGTQSPTTLETGTDGRVRTITETQSTPPGPIPPFSQNDDDGYAYPWKSLHFVLLAASFYLLQADFYLSPVPVCPCVYERDIICQRGIFT